MNRGVFTLPTTVDNEGHAYSELTMNLAIRAFEMLGRDESRGAIHDPKTNPQSADRS